MNQRIGVAFAIALIALMSACVQRPRTPASTTTKEGESTPMPAHTMIEVEFDIFSGMPNPTWVLTDAQAGDFAKRLAALPDATASELSGNLGYRGFVIQMTDGATTRLIRVQAGTVQTQAGATTRYAADPGRALERWLLSTGKPHLKPELYQIAARELGM